MLLPGLLLTLPVPAVAAKELEPASGALELPSRAVLRPPSPLASMPKLQVDREERERAQERGELTMEQRTTRDQ